MPDPKAIAQGLADLLTLVGGRGVQGFDDTLGMLYRAGPRPEYDSFPVLPEEEWAKVREQVVPGVRGAVDREVGRVRETNPNLAKGETFWDLAQLATIPLALAHIRPTSVELEGMLTEAVNKAERTGYLHEMGTRLSNIRQNPLYQEILEAPYFPVQFHQKDKYGNALTPTIPFPERRRILAEAFPLSSPRPKPSDFMDPKTGLLVGDYSKAYKEWHTNVKKPQEARVELAEDLNSILTSYFGFLQDATKRAGKFDPTGPATFIHENWKPGATPSNAWSALQPQVEAWVDPLSRSYNAHRVAQDPRLLEPGHNPYARVIDDVIFGPPEKNFEPALIGDLAANGSPERIGHLLANLSEGLYFNNTVFPTSTGIVPLYFGGENYGAQMSNLLTKPGKFLPAPFEGQTLQLHPALSGPRLIHTATHEAGHAIDAMTSDFNPSLLGVTPEEFSDLYDDMFNLSTLAREEHWSNLMQDSDPRNQNPTRWKYLTSLPEVFADASAVVLLVFVLARKAAPKFSEFFRDNVTAEPAMKDRLKWALGVLGPYMATQAMEREQDQTQ